LIDTSIRAIGSYFIGEGSCAVSNEASDKVRAIFITREDALVKAEGFLQEQSWGEEVDIITAKIIESNECINVLYHFKEGHAPESTIVCVEKIGGAVSHIPIGS
jgi:hypothetical protein